MRTGSSYASISTPKRAASMVTYSSSKSDARYPSRNSLSSMSHHPGGPIRLRAVDR
ncbi:MAG: hypothetical protein LBQ12_03745 [Deltaproteobacteria bacterium]|nr:hypothetical protein [Deltaproteobacteria bacterium]